MGKRLQRASSKSKSTPNMCTSILLMVEGALLEQNSDQEAFCGVSCQRMVTRGRRRKEGEVVGDKLRAAVNAALPAVK